MATPAELSYSSDEGTLDTWRERAACRGIDVNVFFPSPDDREAIEFAKARYCQWCPVRQECLEWAIAEMGVGTANDDLGIYGGMTFTERRSYHRQRLTAARKSHG